MVNIEQTHIFVFVNLFLKQIAYFGIHANVRSTQKYDFIEGVVKITIRIRPSFWQKFR